MSSMFDVARSSGPGASPAPVQRKKDDERRLDLLGLQKSAGNSAVAGWLADSSSRRGGGPSIPIQRQETQQDEKLDEAQKAQKAKQLSDEAALTQENLDKDKTTNPEQRQQNAEAQAKGFQAIKEQTQLAKKQAAKTEPLSPPPILTMDDLGSEADRQGKFNSGVKWRVTGQNADKTNGYIVKHVVWDWDVWNKNSDLEGGREDKENKVNVPEKLGMTPEFTEFWEAWRVKKGKVYIGDTSDMHQRDTFASNGTGGDTKGWMRVTGETNYYHMPTLTGFKKVDGSPAGSLPVATSEPDLKNPAGPPITQKATALWGEGVDASTVDPQPSRPLPGGPVPANTTEQQARDREAEETRKEQALVNSAGSYGKLKQMIKDRVEQIDRENERKAAEAKAKADADAKAEEERKKANLPPVPKSVAKPATEEKAEKELSPEFTIRFAAQSIAKIPKEKELTRNDLYDKWATNLAKNRGITAQREKSVKDAKRKQTFLSKTLGRLRDDKTTLKVEQ